MKQVGFYIAILIMVLVLTGCISTEGRKYKNMQEQFNSTAIYVIEHDLPRLIEYMDKDQSLSTRDKQPIKRRYEELSSLANQLKVKDE